MPLGLLIKHLNPSLHKEYQLETFREGNSGARHIHRPLDAPVTTVTESMRFDMVDAVIYQYAEKVSDLPDAHYCRQYVRGRQIPQKYWEKLYFAEHYNLFLDEIAPNHGKTIKDEARLVIPFYDRFGAICAVSGRALGDSELRYITVRTVESEDKLIYGLERVDQTKLVYITEGPLDSLFLDNAVASGDANLVLTAARLTSSQVVLVFDNEPRSPEIVKQMERAIKLAYKVVIWPNWIHEKDINAMVLANRMPQQVIREHTYSGLTALTMLSYWKRCDRKGVHYE